MPLNPNRSRDAVNSYVSQTLAEKATSYPLFFDKIRINDFRHLHNVELNFVHPITVISGSNRNGKTTVLMAIACSHFNFDRQDVVSGEWRRATWSEVIRFTNHDGHATDWTYSVTFRNGLTTSTLSGRRSIETKKWSGVAKKENQIGHPRFDGDTSGRHVCLLDVHRINPARHLSKSVFRKARAAAREAFGEANQIKEYLSYILEVPYSEINNLATQGDSKIYCLSSAGGQIYSSFNTASGEDVLISLLEQIMHMPEKSLILIDEIEIGLHSKIQRRLMDVLYIISQTRHIQFIIVSHSYAVIDSVPPESRIFMEQHAGRISTRAGLSTYETLTRMDSQTFPCVEIYVEDDISHWIVDKAISDLNTLTPGFARLVKIYETGSAAKTYNCLQTQKQLMEQGRQGATPACILDGDMRAKTDTNGNLQYPPEPSLFFHFSDNAPERMLLDRYLAVNPNDSLRYHLDNSNPHCLLDKMIEQGVAASKKEAFDIAFECYRSDARGSSHYDSLKSFISSIVGN